MKRICLWVLLLSCAVSSMAQTKVKLLKDGNREMFECKVNGYSTTCYMANAQNEKEFIFSDINHNVVSWKIMKEWQRLGIISNDYVDIGVIVNNGKMYSLGVVADLQIGDVHLNNCMFVITPETTLSDWGNYFSIDLTECFKTVKKQGDVLILDGKTHDDMHWAQAILVNRANDFFIKGENENAIKEFESAALIEPLSKFDFPTLSNLYYDNGRKEKCPKLADEFYELYGDSIEEGFIVYMNAGLSYKLNDENATEVKPYFKKALSCAEVDGDSTRINWANINVLACDLRLIKPQKELEFHQLQMPSTVPTKGSGSTAIPYSNFRLDPKLSRFSGSSIK